MGILGEYGEILGEIWEFWGKMGISGEMGILGIKWAILGQKCQVWGETWEFESKMRNLGWEESDFGVQRGSLVQKGFWWEIWWFWGIWGEIWSFEKEGEIWSQIGAKFLDKEENWKGKWAILGRNILDFKLKWEVVGEKRKIWSKRAIWRRKKLIFGLTWEIGVKMGNF